MQHSSDSKSGCSSCGGIMWWTMLLVAVIAIPSLAIIVASMFPFDDLGRMIVFILACWASTWAGMWLMDKARNKPNASCGSTPAANE